MGGLRSELKRDWLLWLATMVVAATGFAVLLGATPSLLAPHSALAIEPDCSASRYMRLRAGDSLAMPQELRDRLKSEGTVTIVFAPTYQSCAEPNLDYRLMFKLADQSKAVVVFDRGLEESKDARAEAWKEGVQVMGSDSVFAQNSSAHIYRPSVAVVASDGRVVSSLTYAEFAGGSR